MTVNLRSLMPSIKQPQLMAYVMGWWGDSSHIGATYDSANPTTVGKQLDLMQAVGIDGPIVVWYGSHLTRIDACCKQFVAQCAQRGMPYGVMIDRGMIDYRPDKTISPTDELINQLKATTLFNGTTFWLERFVLSFDIIGLVDMAKVQAATAALNLNWLGEHSGYGWINAPGTPAAQLAYLQGIYSTGAKIGCVCPQFNDENPSEPAHSIWDSTKPSRRVDGNHGNLWLDSFAIPIPASMRYIGIATWNDYEEGTAVEGWLSAFTGIRIT